MTTRCYKTVTTVRQSWHDVLLPDQSIRSVVRICDSVFNVHLSALRTKPTIQPPKMIVTVKRMKDYIQCQDYQVHSIKYVRNNGIDCTAIGRYGCGQGNRLTYFVEAVSELLLHSDVFITGK